MAGKKKESIDLETLPRDVRRQLNEQQACIDLRNEGKLGLLNDFMDYFKKRGEVELEYARSLDKLADRFEKTAKQRNPRLDLKSTVHLWQSLLQETRHIAKEHSSQADVYSTEMVARFDIISKDVILLAKRCKDMSLEMHDAIFKDLKELNEQSKAYQYSCINAQDAYSKLLRAREKALKANQKQKPKLEKKEKEREIVFLETKFRQLKFRNNLILGMTSCNAITQKYFSTHVLDILETIDYDYHEALTRATAAYREIEHSLCKAISGSADKLNDEAKELDFVNDRAAFMQDNQNLFTPPPAVQFVPFAEDDVIEFIITEGLKDAYEVMETSKDEEANTLTCNIEEDSKTLEHMNGKTLRKFKIVTVSDAQALLESIAASDNSPSDLSKSASFEKGLSGIANRGSHILTIAQRGKKGSLEFTLELFQRRLINANRLAKVSAACDLIQRGMMKIYPGDLPGEGGTARRVPSRHQEQPKLFSGNLVSYVEATQCVIPCVISSCIRMIENHGLDMEGIFRVPGPAQHIDDLRKAFEDGVDPLFPQISKRKTDIAAIASTLKAYFRDLSDPLFPIERYVEFVESGRIEDTQTRCIALREIIQTLHPIHVRVMKFLFEFLYKVAKYELANKMSSANLALVFGPTLTRAPPDVDPRQLHKDVPAVNVLIQTCIEHHEFIFGSDQDGVDAATAAAVEMEKRKSVSPSLKDASPTRETLETEPPVPATVEEASDDKKTDENKDDDSDDSDIESDDGVMTLTVKAVFDYTARNEKELSFQQGDILQVTEKTDDNNWWDGSHDGKHGFIPVAYVEIINPSVHGSMSSLSTPVPPVRKSSIAADDVPDPIAEETANEMRLDFERKESTSESPVAPISEDLKVDKEEEQHTSASPEGSSLNPEEPPMVTVTPEPPFSLPVPTEPPPVITPTSSPPTEDKSLAEGRGDPSRSLSPVNENERSKIISHQRHRSGSGTGGVKNRIAAFEKPPVSPVKSVSPLGPPVPASGHHRSVSVDETYAQRRASDVTGMQRPVKKVTSFEPVNLSSTIPKAKVDIQKAGPNVKEIAQQGGIQFPPMPHGQYQASPLQMSYHLRQTEGAQPSAPEDPKKRGPKPQVMSRPVRPSQKGQRGSQGDQLSAELKATLQTKSSHH